MASKKYILSEQAQQDIENIWWYIAQDNPPAADKISDDIYDACSLLGERPFIGHVRSDLTHRPLRFWPVYNYLIIYRGENSPIEILYIMSGYRDLEKLLDSEL